MHSIKVTAKKHWKRRLILASFLTPLLLLGSYFLLGIISSQNPGIKSDTQDTLGIAGLPKKLTLSGDQLSHTYTSPATKTKFSFNAIAPLWETGKNTKGIQKVALRVSDDGQHWSRWMEIDGALAARDDKRQAHRFFPETPLFITGNYYQYKMTLRRASADKAAPVVSDVKINYLDSRLSTAQKVSLGAKRLFARATAGSSGPYVISRAEWGSPDPNGTYFKGTDKYWAPQYSPVKQVFLHHTVSPNVHSDPKALVRGIWNYHANTLGWGDIGYNYVVDFKGNIFEGRYGGNNVIGGHTYGYNKNSMGVSVLGCFQPNSSACQELNGGNVTPPTSATIDGLSTLLSYKTSLNHINPTVGHDFCDSNGANCLGIGTIAAHRDAGETECNGQLFYDKLGIIRQKVAEKNARDLWGLNDVHSVQKATHGDTQQLFYATTNAVYSTMWGPGISGLQKKKIMNAPTGEQIVSINKITQQNGTTQNIYIATTEGVYEVWWDDTHGYSTPAKLIDLPNTTKVIADLKEESGEVTHRLYVLAKDGPYEYWWRSGTGVSAGSRLWNINDGVDMVKTKNHSGLDELYVASKSAAYRMMWPFGSDNSVQKKVVTNLKDTVAIDKQTLDNGTELFYTATKSGVHETWWKPGTGFSDPAKIIHISGLPVVDIKKTTTNGYHQLYVADKSQVQEFWWSPGDRIHGGKLIRISQNDITAIDKSTRGSYQNLYTAHNTFVNETWWGRGKLGNGPAIAETKE